MHEQASPRRWRWSGTLALTLTVLLLLPLAFVQGQPAQSFGAAPARLSVEDALAGQQYVRTVTLQNQLDTQSTISYEREGITALWTTPDQPEGFTMPARSNKEVTLTIAVPSGAKGAHGGEFRFVTEPKGEPDGTGLGIRYAVSIPINVTIGGQTRTDFRWLSANVEDVSVAAPVKATVGLINVGNVRAEASVEARMLAFTADQELANQTLRIQLNPGETGTMEADFGLLPLGQYRMQFRSTAPAGLVAEASFKVHEVGVLPPGGELRALLHGSRARVGEPLQIQAWFENLGPVPVQAAFFEGEVWSGQRRVETIHSDPTAVAGHAHANLTFSWTPKEEGVYRFLGHAVYDDYASLNRESQVEVLPKPVEWPRTIWLGVGGAFAALLGLGLVLERRTR